MEKVVRSLGCEQVTMKAADDVIKKTMRESLVEVTIVGSVIQVWSRAHLKQH